MAFVGIPDLLLVAKGLNDAPTIGHGRAKLHGRGIGGDARGIAGGQLVFDAGRSAGGAASGTSALRARRWRAEGAGRRQARLSRRRRGRS